MASSDDEQAPAAKPKPAPERPAPSSSGLDRESLEKDCEMEFFRSGGPGGQHRNKTETGVRLKHLPTGIVVTATERRSQARNRELAYERLAEKLRERRRKRKKRVKTKPTRASKERRLGAKRQRSEIKRDRRSAED